MRMILASLRHRLAHAEQGFTTVIVMGTLLIVTATAFVAYDSVQSDIAPARSDQDRKEAYAAAEAGVNEYLFHLSQDNAYWSHCTSVPQPAPVNQPWNGSGADPRQWRTLPGSTWRYTIELLPVNGYSQCTLAAPDKSMIDASTRTIRIRVTGRARGNTRSIVAVFKRRGFLDYVYYTDYETLDPAWYVRVVNGAPTSPDLTAWASANCATYYRQGRASKSYTGTWFDALNVGHPFTTSCTEIQFVATDKVQGPFHTNDEIFACPGATFGRNSQDQIEVSAPSPGWRTCGGSGSPNWTGTLRTSSPLLTAPPSDSLLKTIVAPAYRFTGKTTIVLNGANMTVNGVSMALPSNGVIYVQNGLCGQGYIPYAPYTNAVGCGDVWLKGTYSSSLTIASEKDIIINGNVTHTNDALLGLIADNFVRVYHPTTGTGASCVNSVGTMNNVTIDAAILSLQHSFTVDNYFCGTALSNLTVNGVIAQKFRGPVGTSSGGGVVTGYAKAYTYDDRLSFRSPPSFLDPVQSAWRINRQTEQVPATR